MTTTRNKPRQQTDQVDLARLFDKAPPQAYEAECALLGGMILDGKVIGEIVQIIPSSDAFFRPAHAAIYQALVDLYDANQPVDMVHLKQKLEDRAELEQVGGLEYLLRLAESVPGAVAAPHYASIVQDKATQRGLIDVYATGLHAVYTAGDKTAAQHLDEAEAAIYRLAHGSVGTGKMDSARAIMQGCYESLSESDNRDAVPTGFYELDEIFGNGLRRGDMVVLAARPSMGKTALALNIAEHVAVDNKTPAGFFSLEMGKQSLGFRLMSSRAQVDANRVRKRMLSEDDYGRMFDAGSEFSESPLYIDDTPGLTPLRLRAAARRLASQRDVQVIFIDYMQLMTAGYRVESRQVEVSAISRSVKELARELNIPVVVLSQLNRGSENRSDHRPRMSDLRESGSIEQDADTILLLHREEYYHTDEKWRHEHPELVGMGEVIVAKQRNGPTGTVKLRWQGSWSRFANPTRENSLYDRTG